MYGSIPPTARRSLFGDVPETGTGAWMCRRRSCASATGSTWPRARASGNASPALHASAIVSACRIRLARECRAGSRSPCRTASRNMASRRRRSMNPIMTGLRMSAATHAVRNACQPPAPAVLLGAGGRQRLPVHRDHVHLEAALLEQRLGNRPEVVSTARVGGVHQHDRRAVVARFLQTAPGTFEVRLQQPLRPLLGSTSASRTEERLATL